MAVCMLAAKEFTPVKDPQDGYSFVYPFGWQEVPLLSYPREVVAHPNLFATCQLAHNTCTAVCYNLTALAQ